MLAMLRSCRLVLRMLTYVDSDSIQMIRPVLPDLVVWKLNRGLTHWYYTAAIGHLALSLDLLTASCLCWKGFARILQLTY
jgi:hypothetical protein